MNERMQFLDLLLTKAPDAGWKLLTGLFPKAHDLAAPTSEPRWREKPELKPVTHPEYVACVNSVIQKAVIVADSDPVRLAELVKFAYRLPSAQQPRHHQRALVPHPSSLNRG